MGMYTELYICSEFKPSGRDKEAFLAMFDNSNSTLSDFTDVHRVFELKTIQRGAIPHGSPMSVCKCRYNYVTESYFLVFRCDLRNYYNEIDELLSWLMPFTNVSVGEHIGHTKYEDDQIPTMLFKE